MTSVVKVITAVCCCVCQRRSSSGDRVDPTRRSQNPFTQCSKNVDVIIHQSVVTSSCTNNVTTVVDKVLPEGGLVSAGATGGSRRLWRRLEFWRPGHGGVAAATACPTTTDSSVGTSLMNIPAIADLRHVSDVSSAHEEVTSSVGDDMRIDDWSTFSDGGQATSLSSAVVRQPTSTFGRKHQEQLRTTDIILLPSRFIERASERAVERAATLIHDSGSIYSRGQLVPWRQKADYSTNDVTGYRVLPTSNESNTLHDFRLQERHLTDENDNSATDPEMSESPGTNYEDLNAVVRSTAVLTSYRRALPPKSRARASWSLRRPLQEQSHTLHEQVHEIDDQRQRTELTNTSSGRRHRRVDPPASVPNDPPPRRVDGTSVINDPPPRRSHGTWAHGATIAGHCCRNDDVTNGRSRAPSVGFSKPCKSPTRDIVKRRNDVTSVSLTSRTDVSCSTMVVKTTGDVSGSVRLGLANSDIGDSRRRTDYDVIHDTTRGAERRVSLGLKKRLASLEARRSGHHDVLPDRQSPVVVDQFQPKTSKLSKRSSYRLTKMTSTEYQGSDAKMTKWHYIGGERSDECREKKSVDSVLGTQHQQPDVLNTGEVMTSAGKTTGHVNVSSSSVADIIARINGHTAPSSRSATPSGGSILHTSTTAVLTTNLSRSANSFVKESVPCVNNNNNNNVSKLHVIGYARSRDSVCSQSKTSVSCFKEKALTMEKNVTNELITKGNVIRFSIEHEPTTV